jgi:polyisoprenoid-binding protein YceI
MNENSSSVHPAFICLWLHRGMFPPRSLLFTALLALAPALRAADRPLTIDAAQSRVEVAVRATVDSFTGKLSAYEPAIAVGDDGRVTSARLAFRFRDLLTGKEGRDKAMHKWQETDRFPDGLFVLTSLEPASAPAASLVAIGRLTFHGVTRELRFPAAVVHEAGTYLLTGDAPIDTREFGLPIIRMMGLLKVDPLVHVKFHLQGRVTP